MGGGEIGVVLELRPSSYMGPTGTQTVCFVPSPAYGKGQEALRYSLLACQINSRSHEGTYSSRALRPGYCPNLRNLHLNLYVNLAISATTPCFDLALHMGALGAHPWINGTSTSRAC